MTDSTLLDPAAMAFRQAPRDNLFAFYRSLGRITDPQVAQTFSGDGIFRYQTCLDVSIFNGVLIDRLPRGAEAELFESNRAAFKAAGVSGFNWLLVNDDLTPSWSGLLLENGCHFENGTPGMAMNLAELHPLDPPAGLRIEQVSDRPHLQTWVDTFLSGYGLPVYFRSPLYQFILALGLDGPFYNYTGWLDGQPAATATLFISERVAGVYCVSTVPAARRQGLGAALTLHAIQHGRGLGCTTAALQSSEMGRSVYERMGFTVTRQIEMYYMPVV